ncbi:MAG: hypothetical protein Q9162_006959 [Coniocarpon cinnabarinum]
MRHLTWLLLLASTLAEATAQATTAQAPTEALAARDAVRILTSTTTAHTTIVAATASSFSATNTCAPGTGHQATGRKWSWMGGWRRRGKASPSEKPGCVSGGGVGAGQGGGPVGGVQPMQGMANKQLNNQPMLPAKAPGDQATAAPATTAAALPLPQTNANAANAPSVGEDDTDDEDNGDNESGSDSDAITAPNQVAAGSTDGPIGAVQNKAVAGGGAQNPQLGGNRLGMNAPKTVTVKSGATTVGLVTVTVRPSALRGHRPGG